MVKEVNGLAGYVKDAVTNEVIATVYKVYSEGIAQFELNTADGVKIAVASSYKGILAEVKKYETERAQEHRAQSEELGKIRDAGLHVVSGFTGNKSIFEFYDAGKLLGVIKATDDDRSRVIYDNEAVGTFANLSNALLKFRRCHSDCLASAYKVELDKEIKAIEDDGLKVVKVSSNHFNGYEFYKGAAKFANKVGYIREGDNASYNVYVHDSRTRNAIAIISALRGFREDYAEYTAKQELKYTREYLTITETKLTQKHMEINLLRDLLDRAIQEEVSLDKELIKIKAGLEEAE